MQLSAAERQKITINIWTARCIPILLAGVVGYATYVLVVPLCTHYLLTQHNDVAAAIIILTTYFLLFLLMAASLLRLLYITIFDPPYLALGEAALHDNGTYVSTAKEKLKVDGIGGAEYNARKSEGTIDTGTRNNPDSPGLELFYTKDVFTCEGDGKPRWCSYCANWKPDRTHHCSDAGRCILKMDHFCPWVGGPVGETNFKFFIQYTGYTALYCLHLLVVMAIYVTRQVQTEGEVYNPQFAAILGIAIFFFLFTAGMTGTSIDLAMKNLTQVERLGYKTRIHTIAVIKPSPGQLHQISPVLASEHPYHEITYPLSSNEQQFSADSSTATSSTSSPPPMGQSNPPEGHSFDSRVNQGPPSKDRSYSPSSASGNQADNSRSTSEKLVSISEPTGEITQYRHRDRDSKATRTFAILDMKQGENLWDLGSWSLNWETVMGSTFIDWFLPIRRSPCCNHEDAESQFQLGPSVDILKSSVGFMRLEDTRGHRKSERTTVEKPHHDSGHRKRRRRRKRPSDEEHARDRGVRLADLEHQSP